MLRLILSLFAVCVALPLTNADSPDGSLARLKTEYEAAMKQWREGSEAAKQQGEAALKAFRLADSDPIADFSLRFLAIAEKSPDGAEAVDALRMTLETTLGQNAKARETRARAIKILQAYYVAKPQIKGCLRRLTSIEDDDAQRLVADVIARNPDRKIQAFAYQLMIAHDQHLIQTEQRRAALKKPLGKAAVAQRRSSPGRTGGPGPAVGKPALSRTGTSTRSRRFS